MVWRTVTPSFAGDSQHFGGIDVNKIASLFSGTLDVDNVDINSNFTLRSGKGKIRNPANTFSYTIAGSAVVADRTITLPLLTANDTVAVLALPQTFTGAKAFDTYHDIKEITAPAAPAATYHRIYVDASDGHVKRKNSGGSVADLEASSGGGVAGSPYVYDSFPATYTLTSAGQVSPNGLWEARFISSNPDTVNHPGDVGQQGVRVPGAPTGSFARVFYAYPYAQDNSLAFNAPNNTAAPLTLTTGAYFFDFDITFSCRTVDQRRIPPVNPWETAWFLWHYNEADGSRYHHYYISLKSNGTIEYGKKDNAVQAEEQYFLPLIDSSISWAINQWNLVHIKSVGNHVEVWIDGVKKIDHIDNGSGGVQGGAPNTPPAPSIPMYSGRFGWYAEDAECEFSPMTITDLSSGGGGSGGAIVVQPYDYFIYKSGINYIACNGVTNVLEFQDTVFYNVLNSVITTLPVTGGKIILGTGDFSLTTKPVITKNNITIEGMGVDITRILYDMTSTTLGGFNVSGSIGSAYTLTANSLKGSTVLTVASTTGIVAGDWIYCRRLVETTSGSTGRYDAEFHKVESVTGTQVTIEDMLYEDFNTTDTAAFYEVTWVKNFSLKNLTMYENRGFGHNTNVDDSDTCFLLCYGAYVQNVKFEKQYFASLGLQSCFNTTLNNVYFETPQDLVDGGGIHLGLQYGLYVEGASTNTTWTGGWGNRCRHTITNNTNSGATTKAGRQRNIMVTNVTSYNATTASFDLHQSADGVTFNGCGVVMGHHGTVTTSAKGFNFRAPAIMTGCWTFGTTDNCVTIWTDDASAESGITPGANRTIISGCKFQSASLDEQGGNNRRGIRIQSNRAAVTITGCQFYDVVDQGIYIEDLCKDIIISDCIFRNTSTNSSSSSGVIYAAGNVDNLTVTNNIFGSGTSPANAKALYVVTSVDGLVFTGNNVVGMTSKVLNIPAISTGIIVKDNIGMNPFNKITNHTNTSTFTIGFYGGTTATVTASQDYTIVGGNVIITVTGGTGVSATIKDGAGNAVVSSLTTPINAQSVPNGYKINFGAFSVAPTTSVYAT